MYTADVGFEEGCVLAKPPRYLPIIMWKKVCYPHISWGAISIGHACVHVHSSQDQASGGAIRRNFD